MTKKQSTKYTKEKQDRIIVREAARELAEILWMQLLSGKESQSRNNTKRKKINP